MSRYKVDEKLIQAIKENPGARLELDNDAWWLINKDDLVIYEGFDQPGFSLLATLAAMQSIECESV